MLVIRGCGEEPRPRGSAQPRAVGTDPLSYPELGLRMARPRGWTARLRPDDVVELRRPGDESTVLVAAYPLSVRPATLRRDAERAIARGESTEITGRGDGQVGGSPALTAEATGPGGDIAVLAVASSWRSYLLTATRRRAAPADRLREIGTILESVRFSRPG